jgi:hypothetical protein
VGQEPEPDPPELHQKLFARSWSRIKMMRLRNTGYIVFVTLVAVLSRRLSGFTKYNNYIKCCRASAGAARVRRSGRSKNNRNIYFTTVAEPHHLDAAPDPAKQNYVSPSPITFPWFLKCKIQIFTYCIFIRFQVLLRQKKLRGSLQLHSWPVFAALMLTIVC